MNQIFESAGRPDYHSLFKEEAKGHLAILQEGLLRLEREPAQPRVIDQVFRAAHTLKGCLRMMGHMAIQDNVHQMEDMFAKLRSGEVTATSVVMEHALKTLAVITGQLESLWSSPNASEPSPAAVPVAEADTRPPRKEQRQILLVDDSLTSREMQRNILESHGYRVVIAVDGLDALEKVSQNQVQLVVCDVEMPRMDGFDFCRALRRREETKNLPLIFVTTLDIEEEKREGIEAGCQAYMTKGQFDQHRLLETIDRLAG